MANSKPRYSAEERRQQAEQLQESIAAKVAALTDSDEWRRFLDLAGGFHSYSLNNVMLILAQCPTASRVAGFRSWQEKGRQVRKGERGIRIFGYSTKKVTDANGDVQLNDDGQPKTRAVFPILSVFDIEQTDPIDPTADPSTIAKHLEGEDPADVFGKVHAHLEAIGWSVEVTEIPDTRNGYTDPASRRVVIDASLSPMQRAKTALHELAHIVLEHVEDLEEYAQHRGIKECEAESVAYVVAGLLGVDTSDYSIGYVAGWIDGDVDAIRSTAANVLRAVHTIAAVLVDEPNEEEAA